MGVTALVTQALGVQTVPGALIAGVLVGEFPNPATKAISAQLRAMVAALFAPVFFALAGLSVDLTASMSPDILAMTAALVDRKSRQVSRRLRRRRPGRLSATELLALAIGMNARGSTEVIVASVGLSAGALTPKLDPMIVTMAVLTTCAMPPALRWALARTPLRPEEKARLDKEAFEANGFVANMDRFLLAVSDHPNGRLASRLVGLLAGARGKPTTVLQFQLHSARRGQSGSPE